MPLAAFSHSRIAAFGELRCPHSDKLPDGLCHMAAQILVSMGERVELGTNDWSLGAGQDCLFWSLS